MPCSGPGVAQNPDAPYTILPGGGCGFDLTSSYLFLMDSLIRLALVDNDRRLGPENGHTI